MVLTKSYRWAIESLIMFPIVVVSRSSSCFCIGNGMKDSFPNALWASPEPYNCDSAKNFNDNGWIASQTVLHPFDKAPQITPTLKDRPELSVKWLGLICVSQQTDTEKCNQLSIVNIGWGIPSTSCQQLSYKWFHYENNLAIILWNSYSLQSEWCYLWAGFNKSHFFHVAICRWFWFGKLQ